MIQLLLWRHGQTSWNAERRFQGQSDTDLDEVGVRQAAEAAPRLAAREPTLIISSDLRRANRTAQALADLTGLPVRLDPRLRERHFGPWQGLLASEIAQRYPEEYRNWRAGAVDTPGVEPLQAVRDRMVDALRDASDTAGDGGVVVLVTHGGAARAGVCGLLNWPDPLWLTLGPLGNCRVSEVRHDPARSWQLAAHNVA